MTGAAEISGGFTPINAYQKNQEADGRSRWQLSEI
jgi:hypothetical protein